MINDRRIVFDTNALVSYFLIADSVTARAVQKATHEAVLLASEPTIAELAEVLSRRKFDRYASLEERKSFVKLVASTVEMIPVTAVIHACRDPKDDKFLEVAVSGKANHIVTGDKDLLSLNPFHGISILTPAEYLRG
jgi:putative PIN family toxin of toxin-antitoxin system